MDGEIFTLEEEKQTDRGSKRERECERERGRERVS